MKIALKLLFIGVVATIMLVVGFVLGGAFGYTRGAQCELLSSTVFLTTIHDKLDQGDLGGARETTRTTLDIFADTLRSNRNASIAERIPLLIAPFSVRATTEKLETTIAERYQAQPPQVSQNAVAFFGFELIGKQVPAHLSVPSGRLTLEEDGNETSPAAISTPRSPELPAGITAQ